VRNIGEWRPTLVIALLSVVDNRRDSSERQRQRAAAAAVSDRAQINQYITCDMQYHNQSKCVTATNSNHAAPAQLVPSQRISRHARFAIAVFLRDAVYTRHRSTSRDQPWLLCNLRAPSVHGTTPTPTPTTTPTHKAPRPREVHLLATKPRRMMARPRHTTRNSRR